MKYEFSADSKEQKLISPMLINSIIKSLLGVFDIQEAFFLILFYLADSNVPN